MGIKASQRGRAIKNFELLSLLLRKDTTFNAQKLSHDMQMPASSLYRRIESLIDQGLIFRKKRGEYAPHPALLALLNDYSIKQSLREFGRPYLEELSKAAQTVAHLGVFEEDMVTYLVKAGGQYSTVHSEENGQLEAYASALGKLLLAFKALHQSAAYLAEGVFPRLTPHTITNPADLQHELSIIRDQEIAFDRCEFDADLFCIARPVYSSQQEVICAISVSTSYSKMNDEALEALADRLENAAQKMTQYLGGQLAELDKRPLLSSWRLASDR